MWSNRNPAKPVLSKVTKLKHKITIILQIKGYIYKRSSHLPSSSTKTNTIHPRKWYSIKNY